MLIGQIRVWYEICAGLGDVVLYLGDFDAPVQGNRTVKLPKLLQTVCVLLLLPAFVLADSPPLTQFTRVDKNESGQLRSLQVAIVSYAYESALDDVRVDLVSALHIGDASYYAELNTRFLSYDALLYELVAPEGTVISPEVESKSMLSGVQRSMRTMLDLAYQLEEIDYTQPNFVHADLTPNEFSASMVEREESLYTYFWKVFFASIREAKRDPGGVKSMSSMLSALRGGNQDPLKVMLAYDFADLDQFSGMLGDDATSAIIGARNERAIEVLLRELDAGGQQLGIFYGAAHMRDLENRLLQLGFVKVDTAWVDAWLL